MSEMRPPVRVNTRISAKHNDWLDRRSEETSLSKSALISLAVENYIAQTEITDNMSAMMEKMERLEELQRDMDRLKKQAEEK